MSTLNDAARHVLTLVGQGINEETPAETALRYAEVCALTEQAEAIGRLAEATQLLADEQRTANLIAMVAMSNDHSTHTLTWKAERALQAMETISASLVGEEPE